MKIYLVGGAIRDELLGIIPEERDWVVVGSTPEEMLSLGYKPIGKDFPVFLHPETSEEYAQARTERKVSLGYHGFEFFLNLSTFQCPIFKIFITSADHGLNRKNMGFIGQNFCKFRRG